MGGVYITSTRVISWIFYFNNDVTVSRVREERKKNLFSINFTKNQVDQRTNQQNDEKMQKQKVINEQKFFCETTNVARKEIKSKHRVQQQRQQMKKVNIHQHQIKGVFILKKQQQQHQQQHDNVKKIQHLKKVNIHQRPQEMLNKVQKCTKSTFTGNPKKEKNLGLFKLPGSNYIKPGLLTQTKDQLANNNDAFKTPNVKQKPSCEIFAPHPKRVFTIDYSNEIPKHLLTADNKVKPPVKLVNKRKLVVKKPESNKRRWIFSTLSKKIC